MRAGVILARFCGGMMSYYDRAMRSRDRRYARAFKRMGYATRDERRADKDELAAVRAEYLDVVGKRPYHGWDVDELRAKMADAETTETQEES